MWLNMSDDPVAGPVAAVENLLVVDGIVWTPSDIITADHFDGNVLVLSFLKNLIFGGQQLRSPWGTNTCADKD